MIATRHRVEDTSLALERAGLRFRDPETESAYRTWFALDAVSYLRLAVVSSSLGWFVAWLALAFALPDQLARTSGWVFGGIMPLLVVGYWVSYYPGRVMLVVSALINLAGGIIAVWPLASGAANSPHLASLSAVMFVFFACTVFRVPPGLAAAAIAGYLVTLQVLILQSHGRHELTANETWFDSVVPWVACVLGILICCVLTRLSREAYRRERVIEHQQAVIVAEQERSEALLHNVLPDPIAEQLKKSDEPIAEFFPEVTVVFADIVGFTGLATRMPPRDLVALLNDVFSRFDALTAAHGAEKIKTIGDAYMAVSGVPEPCADHVERIADLAIDMRREIRAYGQRAGIAIDCRFGIATGPAVAGVIGQKRFAYDLWGTTVNTSARMEQHGVAGRIQVTDAVRARLEATHAFSARGAIEVKGAGAMDTWFLDGRVGEEAHSRSVSPTERGAMA